MCTGLVYEVGYLRIGNWCWVYEVWNVRFRYIGVVLKVRDKTHYTSFVINALLSGIRFWRMSLQNSVHDILYMRLDI